MDRKEPISAAKISAAKENTGQAAKVHHQRHRQTDCWKKKKYQAEQVNTSVKGRKTRRKKRNQKKCTVSTNFGEFINLQKKYLLSSSSVNLLTKRR
jgi:hypothetical protein